MCGEVVEVYALIGAAACEDDLLGLFRDWRGDGREGETANCGGVGIEEEGICELDFVIGRYCRCDAVEDSVVGPRDNLDSGWSF